MIENLGSGRRSKLRNRKTWFQELSKNTYFACLQRF